jgi:hypothetical protein
MTQAQVETQLKTKVQKKPTSDVPPVTPDRPAGPARSTFQVPILDESTSVPLGMEYQGSREREFELMTENNHLYPPSSVPMPDTNMDIGNVFSWEMIGLGLEEPLPTQEAVNQL